MSIRAGSGVKGTPLALFALLMAGWIGGRVVFWEGPLRPLPSPAEPLPQAALLLAQASPVPALAPQPLPEPATAALAPSPAAIRVPAPAAARPLRVPQPRAGLAGPRLAGAAPQVLAPATSSPSRAEPATSPLLPAQQQAQQAAPLPFPPQAALPRPERWALDAWGFFRQGSDSAPISQGRVPIYGASQIGAIAQLRVAARSRHDPRLYLRAYRAMVARGESEGAAGGSIRPIAGLPLRAFAELRYTDGPFARGVRPSLFLVSELPPQALPADFTLEAYGQAGWVGGEFATPFADGQASLARELTRFTAPGGIPLRLSAGVGAWGGAQKDAQRLDIGPTLRLEWTMGQVPARFSIDWREQVAGDAAPESGIAATLSTSF